MLKKELIEQIFAKQSFLCVGLDIDLNKVPQCLKNKYSDTRVAIISFACDIIKETAPYTVAYKLNVAFFERMGSEGVEAMEIIIEDLKMNHPEVLVIADAKRGDIGNTAKQYAEAVFDNLRADAVTLNPYMGHDSVAPFLTYKDENRPQKNFWSIILALTSNPGGLDFQMLEDKAGIPLYQHVLATTSGWKESSSENTMYVIGATRAEMLSEVRKIVPNHFLLVPGVGAQGGSLEDVAKYGMTLDCGLLVNSSRGIIYADSSENYAQAAGAAAKKLQQQMAALLPKR